MKAITPNKFPAGYFFLNVFLTFVRQMPSAIPVKEPIRAVSISVIFLQPSFFFQFSVYFVKRDLRSQTACPGAASFAQIACPMPMCMTYSQDDKHQDNPGDDHSRQIHITVLPRLFFLVLVISNYLKSNRITYSCQMKQFPYVRCSEFFT